MSTAAEAKATPTAAELPPLSNVEVTIRVKALALREAEGGYSILIPALRGCGSDADAVQM